MTKRKRALSERDIELQIVDLLTAHGWLVMRTNKFHSGNAVVVQGSIEKGIPDLQARKLCWRVEWKAGSRPPWDITWIEVKRPGEEPSDGQKEWHLLARKRGETVIVCDSVEQAAEYFGIRLEAIA